MEFDKLKQLMDWTKQYQSGDFWQDILRQNGNINSDNSNPFINSGLFFQQADVFPKCDLYEEEGSFVIEADIPGLERKDFKVTLQNQTITLSGHYNTLQPKIRYFVKERPSMKFKKSISLPEPVYKEKISTTLINGVLKIILPIHKDDSEQVPIFLVSNPETVQEHGNTEKKEQPE